MFVDDGKGYSVYARALIIYLGGTSVGPMIYHGRYDKNDLNIRRVDVMNGGLGFMVVSDIYC